MTARSFDRGHPIEFNDEKKRCVYSGTTHVVDHLHYCSVCGKSPDIQIINGKKFDIDHCISNLVKVLNDAGMKTVASCCGHKRRPGNIVLSDGREIIICPDFESARKIDAIFPALFDE